MTQTPRTPKLRMNTDELIEFREWKVTLNLSLKNTESALEALKKSADGITARLDRMDARWDERMRVVENQAIECKKDVESNKEDIGELKKHSDNRDWLSYIISGAAAVVGMFINPK